MLKILRTKDYADMSRKTANLISAQIILKPDCVLGLATGSSPVGAYMKLVDWYKKGDVDFSRVCTVNLDEYLGLPRENDQSYYYFMHHNLFDHVNLPEGAFNLPNGMAEDMNAECARYDALIRSLGGVDLQLLGIGHDGHIGFNEPCDHFPTGTHVVDLAERTIEANQRFFASRDEVPRKAVTMGIGTIMAARKVVLVASGAEKAPIVKEAFFGPVTPQVPASILQMHPDVTLVADEAALSLVK